MPELSRAHPRAEEHEPADEDEGEGGEAGDRREPDDEDARDPHRLGGAEDLARELGAERGVGLLAGDAGDEDAGGGGEDEGGDLRDEAVADGEQAIAFEGGLDLETPLADADREPAQDVDDRDDEARDDVALR